MALKVKETQAQVPAEQPATGTTAISIMSNLSSLVQGSPSDQQYFPRIKMLWAIEAQNSPDKYEMADVGKLMTVSGGATEVIPDDSIVTLIASRNAIKKTIKSEEGTEYEFAYQQMGDIAGATAQKFSMNKGSPEWADGVLMLVAVIRPDGGVAIVEWPVFKSEVEYFYNRIQPAQLVQKMGLKLNPCNHMKNLKAAKSGKGSYLDPKRFTAHELLPLTSDQIKSVADAVVAQEGTFNAWLRK